MLLLCKSYSLSTNICAHVQSTHRPNQNDILKFYFQKFKQYPYTYAKLSCHNTTFPEIYQTQYVCNFNLFKNNLQCCCPDVLQNQNCHTSDNHWLNPAKSRSYLSQLHHSDIPQQNFQIKLNGFLPEKIVIFAIMTKGVGDYYPPKIISG